MRKVRVIGPLWAPLFGLLWLGATVAADSKYPISAQLEGPPSPYSAPLASLGAKWPPARIDYAGLSVKGRSSGLLALNCLSTPGAEFAIGIEQVMWVQAPLERVAEVLEDVSQYAQIFDGYAEIRVVSKDANKWVTYWEQRIPVPFIPNVKYQMTYLIGEPRPERRVYRYQLKDSNRITRNDGLIVLEPDGPGRTRYTEYDFWDADWGMLKTFAPGRIWRDSVEGIAASDYAIRLKAEHPEWASPRVLDESKALVEKDENSVKACIQSRREVPPASL